MRDLRNLLVFRVVARTGGFSSASRVLSVTPAAVSRSMARLEEELNVRLFNRTTRRFGLTDEGAALYERIDQSLGDLESALEMVGDSRGPSGVLRVSLVSTYGKFFVLPRLAEFLEQFPDIRLHIRFHDDHMDLIEEGVDVAVCFGQPKGTDSVSRVICRPVLRMAASPAYLARHGVPADVGELERVRFLAVGRAQAASKAWDLTPPSGGAARTIRFSNLLLFDQAEGVVSAALNGLGVTIAASYALDGHFESGALVPLLSDHDIQSPTRRQVLSIVYMRRQHLPARARAFVDFIVRIAKESREDPPLAGQ